MKTVAITLLVFLMFCVLIGLARSEDDYSVTRMSSVVRVEDKNCAIFRLYIRIPDDPTNPSISYHYGCRDDQGHITVKPIEFNLVK